jgi:hypothetical protein
MEITIVITLAIKVAWVALMWPRIDQVASKYGGDWYISVFLVTLNFLFTIWCCIACGMAYAMKCNVMDMPDELIKKIKW